MGWNFAAPAIDPGWPTDVSTQDARLLSAVTHLVVTIIVVWVLPRWLPGRSPFAAPARAD